MADLKPEIPNESLSTTLIVGVSNTATFEQKDTGFTYGTMSYTVGTVSEAADSEPHGAPSQPLNQGAVRALDSVLRSHIPEAARRRDTSGEH